MCSISIEKMLLMGRGWGTMVKWGRWWVYWLQRAWFLWETCRAKVAWGCLGEMGVGNEGSGRSWWGSYKHRIVDCCSPWEIFFPLNSAVVDPGGEQRSGKQNRARVGNALDLVCTWFYELQRVFEAFIHSTQNGEKEIVEGLGSSAST